MIRNVSSSNEDSDSDSSNESSNDSKYYEMMERLRTRDRLSELPDSLILQILSFLEMRDVVRTSLLSRRWEGLWTTIPCLYFNESKKNNLVQTRNFINRALMLWKGTKILKFNVSFCNDFDESLSGDMDLWVRFATERKVEELYIHFPYDDWEIIERDSPPEYPSLYLPPRCLYSCSSIRKLSLVGCNLHILGNVHWDQLKSLTIRSCFISENLINQVQNVIDQVVSGTPQLEIFELSVHSEKHGNLSIRSSSLKKLSIKNICVIEKDPDIMLMIWAPNLQALIISGPPYSKCLLMDVPSLTDVTLDFEDESDITLGRTLEQILPIIQHVEAVKLSYHCFKMLRSMKGKYSIPQLPNVKLLRFSSDRFELNKIVGLLEIFPKLKMLGIDQKSYSRHSFERHVGPSMPKENIIKSFLMQLRTVEICLSWYESSIFQLIEFLLKHSSFIEKIVIQKRHTSRTMHPSKCWFRAAQKLLSLQRSFPAVELIFCLEGSSSAFQ
ncbi:hypothetical protein C2S53_004325 [Perilla frutescens var. hirtella]|uniref:F-box domain-containing protein n=1 Tax=Perilla frutescens var. hirtella TaxID=608512 RepID=A0AAD4NXK7_PERFH|nr:hypothetical protein C2S53_004325 [Perilla frutescens var. hirtella]